MPSVTRLQPSKKRRDLVNVYIDDEYAFSLPTDLAAPLSVGHELSPDELAELRDTALGSRALDRSLRFLSYRPRSRREIERYLDGKRTPSEISERTMVRLERMGLVDDLAFAEWWVDNRSRLQPRGPWALRQELMDRGVSAEVVTNVMAELDETQLAHRLAGERAARYSSLDRQTFKHRLGAVLARRGFGTEATRTAVNQAWSDLEDVKSDHDDRGKTTA